MGKQTGWKSNIEVEKTSLKPNRKNKKIDKTKNDGKSNEEAKRKEKDIEDKNERK